MPIFYACERCAACCRWPGLVRLTDAEITAMAGHLGLTEFDFIQQYTRVAPDQRGLALTDQENGACVFLEAGNCRVQAVKPQQCRDFPNLWNFPGFEKICHALPHEVSAAEYLRRVAAATKRTEESVRQHPTGAKAMGTGN